MATKTKTLDDVLSFAQVGLGLELYDWQLDMVNAIDKGSKYERIKCALVAPNGSGKTQRIVAVSALRWLNKYPKGRVIITSADGKQLDSQLMPALLEHKAKFPNWEFLQRQVRTPAGGFVLGFTTDDSARAEGHHATPFSPLLIIVDEAKSVEEEIFQAFDRCSYNVLLYISSPGIKLGRFYQSFTEHRPQFLLTAQVGLTDCPHIGKARIQDVLDTYGPDAEFTKSTLYGQFMDQDVDALNVFNFQEVQAALTTPPHAKISRHEFCAFCDFGAGRDENVLAMRSGNKLLELDAWVEKNTVAAVGRFVLLFRKYNLRPEQIWGDYGGIGHSFCDMLSEVGWPINHFDFGAQAARSDTFISRGAEIWTLLSRRISKGEIVLINDPVLISQLTTRQFSYDMRGRIKLETKEEMAARGIKSPDRADAVCGAFAHGNQSFADFVRKLDPWEQLTKYYDGHPDHDMNQDRSMQHALEELGSWPGG
jgi:hypothetical protein